MINDVVFIEYYEPNAEFNFRNLLDSVSHGGVARVKNVKGIIQAHLEAAKKAGTPWFYVVDGDNWVYSEFKFDYEPKDSVESTYVWRCKNASNDLVYGYGGIKLFHRRTLIDRLQNFELKSDMTTGLFKNFYPIDTVASETRFATDPFNAWKGAFRECAKLASKSIARQKDDETEERLKVWTTYAKDPFKFYILLGAHEGKKYGESAQDISKINDFDWLKKYYLRISS